MNKERLLRLADRMDKVKPEHFDIRSWSSILTDDGTIPDYVTFEHKGDRKVLLREGFCGSTACVLGQAALIKEFNNDGLYIDLNGDGRQARTGHATVVYFDGENNHFGQFAGQKFFDIPLRDASLLFFTKEENITTAFYLNNIEKTEYDHHEIEPKHVAAALRRYVETDGASLKDFAMKYRDHHG